MIPKQALLTASVLLLQTRAAAHMTGQQHHGKSGLGAYTGHDPGLMVLIIVLALLMVLLAALRAIQLYRQDGDATGSHV